MATLGVSVAAKLKRIRATFIKQIPVQMEAIRGALKAYAANPSDGANLELLHRSIHNLKGASASFGLSRLSANAALAEKMAKEALQTRGAPDRKWIFQVEEYLDEMAREVADLESSEAIDLQALEIAAVAENSAAREDKTVYLCEDDSFQRMSLSTQIGCFGFKVMAFKDIDELYAAVKNSPPDAVVTGLTFPRHPLGGAKVMEKLQAEAPKGIPTIFISTETDFSSRLAAVRAGSSAYFVKPVDATRLCATLTSLTVVEQPEPSRIMIVDDDKNLSQMYSAILQGAGMVTMELNDPLQVMSHLQEFRPDLIMTDMHMPGCNGMELAKTIRQIDTTFSIPIIFLSSETDIDKQFNAMRMGGDEFLTKPIKPEHLVSAVTARTERMKVIRSLMQRDSTTGLFNPLATRERLEGIVSRSLREKKEACFAVIDLDEFRKVNDSYGHATGDRVLVTLAHLLRQRLRKSDVVGRHGEKVAAILPECSLTTASELLNELRESFAAIEFPAGEESFSATFSCGVARLFKYKDGELLCKAAETALREAKAGGRNRVVAADGAAT